MVSIFRYKGKHRAADRKERRKSSRWKSVAFVLLLLHGLFMSSTALAAPLQAVKKTIGIGNLLKTRYTVTIDADDILRCNWSVPCINQNYRKLLNAPHIDIIIGVGVLNSSVFGRLETYAKPLILLGVIAPEYQKIPVTAARTSGVHNLTYVMVPQSIKADLEAFYKIYPYKKIGLIEDRRLMEVMPGEGHLRRYLAGKRVAVREIAVEDIAALPDGFSPSWDVIMAAELINPVPREGALEINLQKTIHEALAAERQGVLSREQAERTTSGRRKDT